MTLIMSRNYPIGQQERKAVTETAGQRLASISQLLPPSQRLTEQHLGRNLFTRTLDRAFAFMRNYLPPIHWLGAVLTALIFFLYVRLLALTARLATTGERDWPDVPAPCVLALWHRDAPSLLVAFAKRRPPVRTVIMIAGDPRGDYLALLCRFTGLGVVRGDSEKGGWEALLQLARELADGACVIMTAEGRGPARTAKVGAVALASAAGVPLMPLAADCYPAIEERNKWDAARNPVPFGNLIVLLGPERRFKPFVDLASVEEGRSWLEVALTRANAEAVSARRSG